MNIYTKYFKLNLLPFENVPDPLFFYDYGDYALIRKHISGSLQGGRGLIVVIGPIGSGKTTLSQMIKFDFPDNINVIWMGEPPTNSTNLYLFLAQELGLQPSSTEKTFVLRDIRQALLTRHANGKKCLAILDESHLMTDDVINGIRMLNNLEEGSTKLIQMLLLGQDELMATINRPDMEPFKQRIATLEILGKMNADTLRRYVSHRLQVAGGNSALISETGWEALAIAFGGGGTPRLINALCDQSFSVAFERKKPAVDARDVYEATQRMGLITDVFHYICLLNTQERESKDAQPTADKPVAGTSGIKMAASQRLPAHHKASKAPLTLLLLSIVAFILSILFFCHRAPDSSGLLDCFMAFRSYALTAGKKSGNKFSLPSTNSEMKDLTRCVNNSRRT